MWKPGNKNGEKQCGKVWGIIGENGRWETSRQKMVKSVSGECWEKVMVGVVDTAWWKENLMIESFCWSWNKGKTNGRSRMWKNLVDEVKLNEDAAEQEGIGKPLVKWIIRLRKKKPWSAKRHSQLFIQNAGDRLASLKDAPAQTEIGTERPPKNWICSSIYIVQALRPKVLLTDILKDV